MNKAFVREPDVTDELCPRCGAIGVPVQRSVVLRHVRDPATVSIAEVANFCPSAGCDVVYFDMFERTVALPAVRTPVYPKASDAPICACFGLTTEDIDRDLSEGVATRTKACLMKARTAEARCGELSPTGQPCVAEVQRYFLRHKA
ncbi:MAG: hypothetical protein ACKO38_00725 [Planctomycetota bacterium]